MWRIIIVTFAFLGWSFFTLSGGADYHPREGSRQAEAQKQREAEQLRIADDRDMAPEPQVAAINLPDMVTRDTVDNTTITAAITPQSQRLPEPARQSLGSGDQEYLAGANVRVASLTLSEPAAFAQAAGYAPTTMIEEDIVQEDLRDLRRITGTSVNMRAGPGTRFGVLTRVTRDTEVEVLESFDNGWLRLRVLDTQRIGWVSGTLVSADQG
ncbi:MAG: SH3 domain-containing protein [Paracoccaceae bacterium]